MQLQTLDDSAVVVNAEPVAIAAGVGPVLRGSAHFITLATLFRRPLFLDPDGARAVARAQGEDTVWGRSRCLAWVLMPDRWQGLVDLDRGDCLDRLVNRFKGISSRAVPSRFLVNGWLWSKGFNERALDSEESLVAVARHLIANPVRAGLAKSVGDYPYWDSAWLGHKCDGAWTLE